MQHKFPFVSLQMQMEGNDLDVNVHPAKREVRFAREQEVYEAVYDTVRRALTGKEMIPKVSVGRPEPETKETPVKSVSVPEPFEKKRREQLYGHTEKEMQETGISGDQSLFRRRFVCLEKNKVMDGTAGLPEYRKRTLRFVQRFSYNGNKEASGFFRLGRRSFSGNSP